MTFKRPAWFSIKGSRATRLRCCMNADISGNSGCRGRAIRRSFAWALQQEAIVITIDADFHAILAVSGANGPSVIRIRRRGLDAVRAAEVVERVLVDYRAELMRGSLGAVKSNKITSHRLPIGGRRSRIVTAFGMVYYAGRARDPDTCRSPRRLN